MTSLQALVGLDVEDDRRLFPFNDGQAPSREAARVRSRLNSGRRGRSDHVPAENGADPDVRSTLERVHPLAHVRSEHAHLAARERRRAMRVTEEE